MKPYAKQAQRKFRRRMRVRNRIRSSRNPRIRLSIHKTAKHIYAQVIDDATATTIAHVSSLDKELREKLSYGGNVGAARAIGTEIARRALEKGVSDVAFDRGAFKYHGRVKALAEAAREGGLKF